MKLAIFDASGFVGKVLVKSALEKGHEVRALVRNPSKLEGLQNQIECIQGDYYRSEDILKSLEGCDAELQPRMATYYHTIITEESRQPLIDETRIHYDGPLTIARDLTEFIVGEEITVNQL